MARLRRYEEHRYLGTRDDMVVYDCDDPEQLELLTNRNDAVDLVGANLVQSFGPDTLAEARNRGFRSR